MKKNILLLLSIIALFLIFKYGNFTIPKERVLLGTKLNSYLYSYNLVENNEIWSGFNIQDNDIYYLIETNKNYELYKRNIYTKNSKKLKELPKKNNSCLLKENYIECTNNENILIYDYQFKILYKTKIKETKEDIIPYKDTFLKLENNTIYLNQNEKEIEWLKLPQELIIATLKDYFYTKENTYLLLYERDIKSYYLYNINDNTYELIEMDNSNKYNNGFYFYNDEKYTFINLIDNSKIEYENPYKSEDDAPSIISEKNKSIYKFNKSENSLNIILLEKNKIGKIPLDFTEYNPINSLIFKNDKLYIELNNLTKFYIIDLEKLDIDYFDIENDIKETETKINKGIKELKNNYNVNINIKENTNIKYPDFTAQIENNNNTIISALLRMKTILEKYNKDVFDRFYLNNQEGLNIYLTSTLTPNNLETQVANPAAYSLNYQNKYMIVMNINEPNIEELLCHELMHNLELVLKKENIQAFKDWNTYNPKDFSYNDSYTAPYKYNYTLTEEEDNNIYFIDTYSHTYEVEDRARIFENICSCNNNSIINNYQNLLKKGQYLQEEIYKYYPSLKETTLFNSMT